MKLRTTSARRLLIIATTVLTVVAGGSAITAAATPPPTHSQYGNSSEWRLVDVENFNKPIGANKVPWVHDNLEPNSPWYVKYFGDKGLYYSVFAGPPFKSYINSFWIMRKRVQFGSNGWLTAEIAQENYSKDGHVTDGPTLTRTRLPNGQHGAILSETNNVSGAVIRSTKPLPPEYRIQYTLNTINFGGERNGSLDYDGKHNGYYPYQCNTSYPWNGAGTYAGPTNPCNSNFADSTTANGYYFLYIIGFPDAPHTNIASHDRKVGFDAYNVTAKNAPNFWMCNPKTKKLYPYTSSKSTRNGINATFSDGSRVANSSILFPGQIYQTPCGTFSNKDSKYGLVESAEIQPEFMPNQSYTFAIERTETGYTLEMTGDFKYIGQTTIREHRNFIQDGIPIWHYNNTAQQYNGQYDASLTDTGKYGSFTIPHIWPKGSHYPDYFMIGDPHLNYYQGSATVSNIRLYVPRRQN